MDGEARQFLAVLEHLLQGMGRRDFSIRLWDGSRLPPSEGATSRFELCLTGPEGARSLLSGGDLKSLGEAYIAGELRVDGDIEAAFDLAYHVARLEVSMLEKFRVAAQFRAMAGTRASTLNTLASKLTGPSSLSD